MKLKKQIILTLLVVVFIVIGFSYMNACKVTDPEDYMNTRSCTCNGFPVVIAGVQYCLGLNEVAVR